MQNLPLLIGKLRKAAAQLPNLPRALRLAWRATRGWTIAWAVLLVFQGLLPVVTVYLTRWLVNSLVPVLGSHGDWQTFRPVLVPMGLMGAVLLLTELLRSATVWVRTIQADLLKDHVTGLVHTKSVELDLAFYDLPEFYDHLHRARDEASYRPVELLESLGSLLQNGITLLAMGAVLVPYGAWLPAAVFVSTLPALYVVLRYTLIQHQWRLKSTSEERRSWYYDWLLTSRETAAELRLFGMGPRFQAAYQALRWKLRQERVQMAGEQGLAELAAGSFGLLITGAALGWMVWKAVQGLVSLGDLALFTQAFNQGQQLMRSLLQNVGHLYSNSLFLGNLFEFLALKPKVIDGPHPIPIRTATTQIISEQESDSRKIIDPWSSSPHPLVEHPLPRGEGGNQEEGISFRHVTFRYPGSQQPALWDFSLNISTGKKVAVVGLNGSGKSTLIKLLCRFYDPDEGLIELDGTDLRDLPIEDLRKQLTVLFQEPVHFNNTVAENIALGDLAKAGSAWGFPLTLQPLSRVGERGAEEWVEVEMSRVNSQKSIEEAARTAGAEDIVHRLPQRYDNPLGKWFVNGAELSVGEWQRIALARAFFRQAPIILLDEPTSAMDPWAEADWLDRFSRLAQGRTVLIITHRFTTAMHADVIHVMADGRIVESGSHAELLARGGDYAQSWAAQMREDKAGERFQVAGAGSHVERFVRAVGVVK